MVRERGGAQEPGFWVMNFGYRVSGTGGFGFRIWYHQRGGAQGGWARGRAGPRRSACPPGSTWYRGVSGFEFWVSGFGFRDSESARIDLVQGGHAFKNNCFVEMSSSSDAGSYLRLIDFCITQL